MGFLSKMKNNLTGSWADVTLTVADGPFSRGDIVPVRADVQVKADEIAITSVLVEIYVEEVVNVRSVMSAASTGPIEQSIRNEIEETLHSEEVILASAQQLAANSASTFEGQVRLPQHMPASARGRHAEFRWSIRARVDMKGNDPDSGWTTIEVR